MGKHVGEYDQYEDIRQAVNEAIDHEPWCHWDCPGHRSCGCGAEDSLAGVRWWAFYEGKIARGNGYGAA